MAAATEAELGEHCNRKPKGLTSPIGQNGTGTAPFLQTEGQGLKGKMEAAPPATSRHTSPPLWLLPSGPDQVHGLSLREDQQGRHNKALRPVSRQDRREYKHPRTGMQTLAQGTTTRIASPISTTPLSCSTCLRWRLSQASRWVWENSSATRLYQRPSTRVAVITISS